MSRIDKSSSPMHHLSMDDFLGFFWEKKTKMDCMDGWEGLKCIT